MNKASDEFWAAIDATRKIDLEGSLIRLLRIGGLRIIHRQITGNEIRLEYANTRDAVYELYEQIFENRDR